LIRAIRGKKRKREEKGSGDESFLIYVKLLKKKICVKRGSNSTF